MIYLIALMLSADCSSLVTQLGSAKFHERESAQKQLTQKMNWALAIRLEHMQVPSLEAQRRKQKIADGYWNSLYPLHNNYPYIDSLNPTNCNGNSHPRMQMYYNNTVEYCNPHPYGRWRSATYLMLQDCATARIPPILIRLLLWIMEIRSELWDRSRR